jgi:hypothetical protein
MNMATAILCKVHNDPCERMQIEEELVPTGTTEAVSKTPPDWQREIITSPQMTSRM